MITFEPHFEQSNQDYMLFELPEEIESKLSQEGKLHIKNYNNESYFIGSEKIYLIQKIGISNSLLITQPQNDGYISKTIKNNFLAAKEEAPNISDIIDFLTKNSIKKGENCLKEILKIDTILENFPLTKKDLLQVTKKLDGFIHENHIIILQKEAFFDFCEEIICEIKDKDLSDQDGKFKFYQLTSHFGAQSEDKKVKLVSVMKNYFNIEEDKGKMEEENAKPNEDISDTTILSYSFQKMAKFCIEQCLYREHTWILEDMLGIITDALEMYLPAKVRSQSTKEERAVFISRELQKKGIISDAVDYKKTNSGYNKDEAKITYFDFKTLPENPIERLQYLISYRKIFSSKEIRFFFRELFAKEKKYGKFVKNNFKKVSKNISLQMYPTFCKYYPAYEKDGLIKAHSALDDFFQLQIFSVQKLWV